MPMSEIIGHSRPTLGVEEVEAVRDVLLSGQIAQGMCVGRFERKMAEFVGRSGGVATSSGTAALHLALLALGTGEGHEVIIPTYVCTALLNAVNYVGAHAVVADIDPRSYNICPDDVRKRITRRTKAIILPHMFGLPADVDEILKIGIPVIEDFAVSVGALYKGKRVGGFGAISIVSFYGTKMLGTGEGGMALSDDKGALNKMKDLREYDNKEDYKVRYNYKMADMVGALGIAQLKKLPEFLRRRKEIANRFNCEFKALTNALPISYEDRDHVFYRYVVDIGRKSGEFIEAMGKRKITCARPVHLPIHGYLGLVDCPNADTAWDGAVSLPIYPSMSEGEANIIVEAVRDLLAL